MKSIALRLAFHREKRSKAMKSSLLDDIKGLGPRRKEMIYRAYPDVNILKNASVEELEQILPSPLAKCHLSETASVICIDISKFLSLFLENRHLVSLI